MPSPYILKESNNALPISFTRTLDYQNTPDAIYGNPTPPAKHTPEQFRYLVHGYNPATLHLLPYNEEGTEPTLLTEKWRHDYQRQRLNSYNNPFVLGDRITLSTSLIDQDHRTTYADAGYILETTHNNVITAREKDLYLDNWNPGQLLDYAAHGRYSGEELLKETASDAINEVLIGGNLFKFGPIKITGVFYKEHLENSNDLSNSDLLEHFIKSAVNYGLHLVAIPD